MWRFLLKKLSRVMVVYMVVVLLFWQFLAMDGGTCGELNYMLFTKQLIGTTSYLDADVLTR